VDLPRWTQWWQGRAGEVADEADKRVPHRREVAPPQSTRQLRLEGVQYLTCGEQMVLGLVSEHHQPSPAALGVRFAAKVAAFLEVVHDLSGGLLGDPEPVGQFGAGQSVAAQGLEDEAVHGAQILVPREPARELAHHELEREPQQELSTWLVRMNEGAQGPLHAIDREQVWMTTSGRLSVEVDGVTHHAVAGEAAVLPAGVMRRVSTVDGPAEAIVCMVAGGAASTPENPGPIPLPWAQ
jgi:quercetin dioxygenase-like cupin family protein